MIIRYLDGLNGVGTRVDYRRVMSVVEGFDHITSTRATACWRT